MEYVCPFCGNDDFETPDWDLGSNTLETYCECKKCGGRFIGKFDVIFKKVVPTERIERNES